MVNGIAVVKLFGKQGDLASKLLTFFTQLLFMSSLTFYAAADNDALGGVMFLYAIAIGAAWVILLILLQMLQDRNIVVANKFPLLVIVMAGLVLIFFCVLVAAIVKAGAVYVPGGTLIGYLILTWLLLELIQAGAVATQFKFTPKSKQIYEADEEDEYADQRGTFSGVDESVAVKASTTGVEDDQPEEEEEQFESQLDEDADLGLL